MDATSVPNDMLRSDGSKKSAHGYLGPLVNKVDGKTMTEFSTDMMLEDGTKIEIPTLVPTLTPEEVSYIQNMAPAKPGEPAWDLKNNPIERKIINKARQHAKQRMKQGLNPFFQDTELQQESSTMNRGGIVEKIDPEEKEKAAASVEDKRLEETAQAVDSEMEDIVSTPQEAQEVQAAQTRKLPETESTQPPSSRKRPELISMYCGGMAMPGLGMAPDENIVGYDPVSGNPVPIGSSPENVRDDIPAALSLGEYVVPNDVVRWHGLKHFMQMHEEAKSGLMMMQSMDQIKTTLEDDYENDVSGVSSPDDSNGEMVMGDAVEDVSVHDEGMSMVVEEITGTDEASAEDVEYPEPVIIEEEFVFSEEPSEGVVDYGKVVGNDLTVGDEQVLLIFSNGKPMQLH